MSQARSSVDDAEIERFRNTSALWWDPEGPYAMLHALNPTRMVWLLDAVRKQWPIADSVPSGEPYQPLRGLRVVDVGCGGGLIAEPLARLGAAVTAIDATQENIQIASYHATQAGLAIDYRHATAEDLVHKGDVFDVVVALEIIEHVNNPQFFVETCAALVAPGGMLALSTLNRTAFSYVLGIVVAEKIMRWIPKGTHTWSKFIRPRELRAMLMRQGLTVSEPTGFRYRIGDGTWETQHSCVMNYAIAAYRQ